MPPARCGDAGADADDDAGAGSGGGGARGGGGGGARAPRDALAALCGDGALHVFGSRDLRPLARALPTASRRPAHARSHNARTLHCTLHTRPRARAARLADALVRRGREDGRDDEHDRRGRAQPAARRDRPAITSSYFGNHSIRSRDWRLSVYEDGAQELYDHRNDPDEFRNLANDPDHEKIRNELARWLPQNAAPEFKPKSERARARGN